MLITLVSGLAGEIRRLQGSELRQISDPANIRGGGSVELLLRNCFLSTTDPGPYPWLEPGAKPNWDKVLGGDRFDALLQLRAASFGPDYEFPFQCSKCKERNEWEVRFAEFPRKKLSTASFEKIRAGENRFEEKLPDGRLVYFKLPTGAEEKAGAKQRHQNRNAWSHIDALLLQLLELDGVGKMPADKEQIAAHFETAGWADLLETIDRFDDHNCGVETKIEVECSFCRWQQEIEMPFEEAFFRPPRRKAPSPPATTKGTTLTPTGSTPPASTTTTTGGAAPASSATSGSEAATTSIGSAPSSTP